MHALDEKGISYAGLDHQIITPTRKSWVGTAKLNQTLQMLLNPDMKGATVLPRHTWAIDKSTRVAVGDKVLWTQNNYELNIFNGETGIIEETTELGEVIVNWGDRVVSIPPSLSVTRKDGTLAYIDPRKDIDLAYAITTHKAQGSEFKNVIYILNKSCVFMQDQSNYYTAVTRARYGVTLICDQQSFFASLRKPQPKTKKGLDQ
jgi:exodeoxyribonuclease V alpha subunit